MHKHKLMHTIAALLVMLLVGCVKDSPNDKLVLTGPKETIRAKRAPACPTPTPNAKAATIAGYIESAQPAPGLDTLSTEWERLDDGARACRTGRARSISRK